MFGSKKTITDRAKNMVTDYIDTKFEDYRGQISLDLARGLAILAGLVAIWTLAIVCLMFVSISFGLLLGWVLSFWLDRFAFVLSFLIIASFLLAVAYYLLVNKKTYIEDPVFKIMAKALRSPNTSEFEQKKEDKSSVVVNKKTPESPTSDEDDFSDENSKSDTPPKS